MSLMRIKCIEVEQFRQFRDKVVVQDLDAGLNVIAGDNEAGKSTLLQAIRAVLFDRHASTVGERFTPYNAKVSPRVGLVFDVDGVEYRLTKVFSKKKDGEATLEANDGKSWEGQATEEHLADLLGFSYAKKGQSKSEHQGLAGLLWVEQSRAYESVNLSDQSRQQIHAVFENEMRELLGGGQGELLHKRITQLRSEYFDARGNVRGDYKRVQGQASELRQKLADMQAELKAYEDKVDRLERQQAELAAYQEDNVPEKARAQLEQAREAIERVSMLKIQVEGGAEKLERAEADRGVARKAWDSRRKLVEELSASREKASTLSESVIANETELAPRAEGLTVLQTEYTGLKSHRDHLEADLRRARDIETLRQLSTECERLEAARKDAREADSKRRHCISEQGATRVTEASMTRLREIERTQDLAEERLSAVATRIEHRLEPGASVRLGNESLSGEGAVLLTRRTELGIESMGEISIIPGGEDLEALRRKLEEQKHLLSQTLDDIGADSIANAEQTLRHSKRLEVQADQYEATIKGLAPDGLQALEDQYSSAVSRRDKLLSSVGDVSLHEKQASDLEFEAETLREQIRHIEEHLDAEEKAIQQLREMLVAARTEAKTAERDVENVTAELEQARGDISDDDMEKTLTASVRAADEADQSLKAARQALDAENPEAAEAEVERAQRVLNDIGQEIQVLERDVRDLKVELTALGQRGLAEEVASLESENANVDLQFNQMDRRARALDLLQRTLDVALQQAKEAVAQPITDKLVPYLRQLMPDAAPLVNEDLILTGINREGTAEAFSDLSIGTREQLAVLIRLAYADLLSAKGVPVVVILDDALVNSDDGRRDRMKAILYQAAKRYQILLLTCHGREYRDTGGRFIRLEKVIGR